jgi:cation:H+ antiporter
VNIALQIFLLVGGLLVALLASNRAVANARALAAQLGAPAFLVGAVLVSIGTDLPELANSIAAHLQGQADVNVGDSVGSALTQYTLVLGLFPFVAGTVMLVRRQVAIVTLLTVGGLTLVALFVRGGYLSRWEGLALVAAWAGATWILVKTVPAVLPDVPVPESRYGVPRQAVTILLALGLVGFGATVAVRALVNLATLAGVPEFAIAFFGASLGTSAPELVVDLIALRQGAVAIAVGDALGSSLVDSTLSIGIGPLVAPGAVSEHIALAGTLYTLAGVAAVGGLLALRRHHDRLTGVILLAVYALAYLVLLQFE